MICKQLTIVSTAMLLSYLATLCAIKPEPNVFYIIPMFVLGILVLGGSIFSEDDKQGRFV